MSEVDGETYRAMALGTMNDVRPVRVSAVLMVDTDGTVAGVALPEPLDRGRFALSWPKRFKILKDSRFGLVWAVDSDEANLVRHLMPRAVFDASLSIEQEGQTLAVTTVFG